MPYLSLYRKYRSQDFDHIVGQEHITTTLKNAIARDRIAHAYLFSGPRGTGKTSTARIMAKCICCEQGPTGSPCNTCDICTAITADKLFDVIEIDAASNRGIDDVRDLKEKVRVPPTQARRKVYIIDEVHMLTREAFNALLKTLEEPPSHVLFIMATTEPQKLPPTILSRCQRFDFRRLTDAEISSHIQRIAGNENFEIESGAADMIVKTADGSLRDAISILDQLVSFSSGAITAADANLMFGLVEQKDIIEFMEAVFENDPSGAFELFRKFFDAGKSFSLFLRLVMEHLRDLYLLRQGLTPPRDTYSNSERTLLAARAKSTTRNIIVALMDETARVEDRIRWEVYPKIILEILIIKLIDIAAGGGADAAAATAMPPRAKAAKPAATTTAASPAPRPEPAAPAPKTIATPAESKHSQESNVKLEPPEPDITEPEIDQQTEPSSESAEQPDTTDAASTPTDNDDFSSTWTQILAAIKKANLPKYFIFADAKPELTDDETLTLVYLPDHQFKKEQAQEKESIAMLQGIVKQCLGKSMRIRLRIDRGDGQASEGNGADPKPGETQAPAAPPALESQKKYELPHSAPRETAQSDPSVPTPAPAPPKPAQPPADKQKSKPLGLFDEVSELFPGSVQID